MSDAARWMLLAALVYAPWAYGSIPAWALAGLHYLLAATLLLWLADCTVRRRFPPLPLWLVIPCLWLVMQAWWMALNGDQPGGVTRSFRFAPGSVDQELSMGMALRTTTLIGVLCFVCDLSRNRKWRQRLWWTLGLAGSSIVLLGLVQRVDGAPGIFWRFDAEAPTFFATFSYHANAGAYLNVVWPVMAGLLTMALHDQARSWQRVLWTLSLVGCLGALFVNTSRASGFVAVVLMVIWIGTLLSLQTRRHWLSMGPPAVLGRMLALVGLAGLLAVGIGMDRTLARWRQLEGELHAGNPRWQADVTSLRIVGDAGPTGFGPGTFVRVYPLYLSDPRPHFEHAHNDYLQTVIEWGFLGSLAWAILFFGGPIRAGYAWMRGRGLKRTRDQVLAFAGLTALLGLAIHSVVDYPLQIASIQLHAVVIVGLLWGIHNWNGRSSTLSVATPLGTLRDWMGRHPNLCPAENNIRGTGVPADEKAGSEPAGEGPEQARSIDPCTGDCVDATTDPNAIGRICVILNPAARGDRARRFQQHLDRLGPGNVLQPTTAPGTGRALAAQAVRDGFDCIVAAGGDGTMNEVLNGMADVEGALDRVTLGILPMGTSNVFARELGLPLCWSGAWDVIQRGNYRWIDVVHAVFDTPEGKRSRKFVQLAGAGLDARAVELVDWRWKRKAGIFAYITAALRALREPQTCITIETGARTATGELLLIGNGKRYGGPFQLFPQASLGDGLLDAHLYAQANLALALAALFGLITGRVGRAGRPDRFRTTSMRLTASQRTPFQIDGEHVGYLPVDMELQPRALRVIVP